MKILFTDSKRARECVQWVMKNIGPKTSVKGSVVHGEGWCFWCNIPGVYGLPEEASFCIEINQHVDSETATLFMLKWS